MTEAERDAEVARLKRLIKARKRMSGYQDSVAQAEAQVAELEAMTFEPPPEFEESAPEPLPEPET